MGYLAPKSTMLLRTTQTVKLPRVSQLQRSRFVLQLSIHLYS